MPPLGGARSCRGAPTSPSLLHARAPAVPAGASVRFAAWRRGDEQRARLDGSVLWVPLPIPYALPPAAYMAGEKPWMVDVLYEGADSLGQVLAHPGH